MSQLKYYDSGSAQWVAALVGAQGTTGAGTQGTQGLQGLQGTQGTTGAGTQGATGTSGAGAGIPYTFNTGTTSTSSTAGQFNFNNATVSSVTNIYINSSTAGTGVGVGDMLTFSVATTYAEFEVSGTPTLATSTWTFPVTYRTSSGTFTGSTAYNRIVSNIGLQGTQGIQGIQGTQGIQSPQGVQGTQGRSYTGVTSTSSNTVGTGAKTFAVANSGAYGVGTRIRAVQGTNTANFMEGSITALTTDTSLTITADVTGGSGTITNWNIDVAGVQGTQGTQGTQGVQSPQGIQGFQGFQGTQGVQGTQGIQSPQGTTGSQGATGSGAQGTQGIQGTQGTTGTQGPTTINSNLIGVTEGLQTIAAATTAGGTFTVYVNTANTIYYTTASTAASTFTINVTGVNAGTTLASILGTSTNMITVVFLNTTGAVTTSYPASTIQIDGSTTGVTMRWVGGVAPTAGNASSVDAYTYTIIKTAATPTYTVLAQQTKWA